MFMIKKEALGRRAVLRHRIDGAGGNTVSYVLVNVRIETKNALRQETRERVAADTFALYFDVKYSAAEDDDGRKLRYLPSDIFAKLSPSEQIQFFTVACGDSVFPVLSEKETSVLGLSEILRRLSSYTVNSVIPVYGARGLHHLEVTGRGRIID